MQDQYLSPPRKQVLEEVAKAQEAEIKAVVAEMKKRSEVPATGVGSRPGRILFSLRTGSHLYGTNHAESDVDIKHIILPDLDGLLLGNGVKNEQNKTNNAYGQKNSKDDKDEEKIPIHVFARHFLTGQSYALEMAWAVEYTGADQKIHDARFIRFCRELRERFMTSEIKAMTDFAVEQAQRYSFKGERLNAVQDMISEFEQYDPDRRLGDDPVFQGQAKLMEAVHPGLILVTEYDSDGKGTMRPCVKVLDRTLPFTGTFGYNMTTLYALRRKFGERAKKAAESTADWKAVMHAIRVIDEGITLYTTGKLVLPYPDPAYIAHLHDIRLGRISREEANAEVDRKVKDLAELKEVSTWQPWSPELAEELEKWLLSWLNFFYFGNHLLI